MAAEGPIFFLRKLLGESQTVLHQITGRIVGGGTYGTLELEGPSPGTDARTLRTFRKGDVAARVSLAEEFAGGGGIELGNGVDSPDTTLYRSAADTLKTDDMFLATSGLKVDVVATGSLPAAAAAQDGRILIEDVGAGDRNLVIFAGGQRFRIDGGAAF